MEQAGRLACADGLELAYLLTPGSSPTVVFLPGFRSDMQGAKAVEVAGLCAARGTGCLRLDYTGHGASGGRFEDGTIGRWLADALAVIEAHAGPRPLLVGSSMGGWIALLAALRLRAAGVPSSGLVLIAPAVDFTQGMWDGFPIDVKREIEERGHWPRPSAYAPESTPITRALIEDGRRHLLLGRPIEPGCPVHILQGMQDPDVPWPHAMTLLEHLPGEETTLTLVKDGDHRLSREGDLALLVRTVAGMAG